MVSPASNSKIQPPISTRCCRRLTKCISMRLATESHTARCSKLSRSKSASNSRLRRIRRFLLNAAVTPWSSAYAGRRTSAGLGQVRTHGKFGARSQHGPGVAEELDSPVGREVADRRAWKEADE